MSTFKHGQQLAPRAPEISGNGFHPVQKELYNLTPFLPPDKHDALFYLLAGATVYPEHDNTFSIQIGGTRKNIEIEFEVEVRPNGDRVLNGKVFSKVGLPTGDVKTTYQRPFREAQLSINEDRREIRITSEASNATITLSDYRMVIESDEEIYTVEQYPIGAYPDAYKDD